MNSEILSDDHRAVGEILEQLLAALRDQDPEVSFAKLDLLWARLAVHIRAEHLHLFPAVTRRMTESSDDLAPELNEAAQVTIDKLRVDHDFFMHELARAVGVLRELPTTTQSFNSVLETVLEVEKRLAAHNELEENEIYRWAGSILTESQQIELAARINTELENRPSRFTLEAWGNQ
jgi:hemerythrin superfamily protein